MNDDCIRLTVPAVTLGYTVSQDNLGKFRFANTLCEIVYRKSQWLMIDNDGEIFEYAELMEALQDGKDID